MTFSTGLAAHKAALDIQDQMIKRAAELWGCQPDDIQVDAGTYGYNDHKQTFKELAVELSSTGEAIVGRAAVNPQGSTNAFSANIVDVEVDPETGHVKILRFTASQDVGRAIHPAYVEGQIQGGVAQGIGWALNEEYIYDDQGRLTNAGFLDYRIPVASDLPNIDTIVVEVPNPNHPFGVKGVGEVCICLLYTSPSPRDGLLSRMPSSA